MPNTDSLPRPRALLLALALAWPAAAPAQEGLFAPLAIVNDSVVTNFELQQRILFLRLLRAPGDIEAEALDGLIDDRLRVQEAARLGVEATPEQIDTGMEEFAGRANLTTAQFVTEIGRAGVEVQTFRDFVEAGVLWREVIRARFAPRTRVTDAQVDRAITGQGRVAAVTVALSELIIPAEPGREAEALALAQRLSGSIATEAAFAEAVRTYSAAPSAERGGRIDAVPLENLPPAIAQIALALGPGQVSDPVQIPGGVALFQLRGITESLGAEPGATEVDYLQVILPDDAAFAAEAARLRDGADVCDDLYPLVRGLPAGQVLRQTQTMAAVPADIGLELARLDAGESSTALARGGSRVFLMLCARRPQSGTPPDPEAVRDELANQQLGARAEAYLADLRANAILVTP